LSHNPDRGLLGTAFHKPMVQVIEAEAQVDSPVWMISERACFIWRTWFNQRTRKNLAGILWEMVIRRLPVTLLPAEAAPQSWDAVVFPSGTAR
jgi:hypothetical protein